VVGHIVSWTNQDTKAHIIRHQPAQGGPQFDSGPLQPGDGFEFQFTVPGEYAYQCTEGDTELGRVTVR
jgi:plastocyanin